jgi:hypothetical protein
VAKDDLKTLLESDLLLWLRKHGYALAISEGWKASATAEAQVATLAAWEPIGEIGGAARAEEIAPFVAQWTSDLMAGKLNPYSV